MPTIQQEVNGGHGEIGMQVASKVTKTKEREKILLQMRGWLFPTQTTFGQSKRRAFINCPTRGYFKPRTVDKLIHILPARSLPNSCLKSLFVPAMVPVKVS